MAAAQITPLVPEVSSLAPQAQVNANIQLLTVLQQFMDQNKPKTDVSQATPDQVAAASANSKPSPKLADGDKVAGKEKDKNAYGGATLPDVLAMLGLGTPTDPAAAEMNAAKKGAAPIDTSGGGLTQLRASIKGGNGIGDTKIGKAFDAGKSALAFLGL